MRKILSVVVVLSLLLSAGLVSAEEIDWSARRLDKQVTLSFMIDATSPWTAGKHCLSKLRKY